MYKYYATKRMDVNGKTYNPGEIIISDKQLQGLTEVGKTYDTEHIVVNKDPIKSNVDIIFVRFNAKIVEDRAIEYVKKNTNYPNYKIIDYDNYQTKRELSELWNDLIDKSDADYICLLNTDAYVTDNWLNEMMKGFNDDMVAAVGPSGDNVGGIQREIGKKELADNYIGKYKKCIGKDTLSGFCIVIKKSAWKDAGGFPEEVPFYGGEHAFLVKIREKGYKLLWAQGAFVYHLGGVSVKKEKMFDTLRKQGQNQYHDWLVPRIPILFLTYNRLEYTKQSLKCLLRNTPGNDIIIFDNNSTDGTKKWLKKLDNKRLRIIYSKKNIGIAGAMNEFFKLTENKEYIAKVDNDTMIPKNWLETLVAMSEHYKVDILQPKHSILHSRFKTFEEWMKTLKGDHRIRYSNYVGGSGILVRRALIDGLIPVSRAILGGWTQYQDNRPELKKVFCRNIEIKLLDMEKDNKYKFDKYPDYYVEVGRLKLDTMVKNKISENLEHKTSFETIDAILKRINDKFAFVRFGDGEILCLDGWKGRTDYQLNSPKLQKELFEAIKIDDPNYLIGCSAGLINEKGMTDGLFARFDNDKELQEIITNSTSIRGFYSPVALHYLLVFYPNIFKLFIKELKKKRLGFVGNKYMRKLLKILSIKDFIEIPKIQSYKTIDEYYSDIKKMAKDVDIILLSAGITATAIQKRLWDLPVSTIDIGSVLDPLVGINNDKTWIRLANIDTQKLKKSL